MLHGTFGNCRRCYIVHDGLFVLTQFYKIVLYGKTVLIDSGSLGLPWHMDPFMSGSNSLLVPA